VVLLRTAACSTLKQKHVLVRLTRVAANSVVSSSSSSSSSSSNHQAALLQTAVQAMRRA
jgi:hypothetical protein